MPIDFLISTRVPIFERRVRAVLSNANESP